MESETLIETPKLDIEAMLEARKLKNEANFAKLAMVDIGIDL